MGNPADNGPSGIRWICRIRETGTDEENTVPSFVEVGLDEYQK